MTSCTHVLSIDVSVAHALMRSVVSVHQIQYTRNYVWIYVYIYIHICVYIYIDIKTRSAVGRQTEAAHEHLTIRIETALTTGNKLDTSTNT